MKSKQYLLIMACLCAYSVYGQGFLPDTSLVEKLEKSGRVEIEQPAALENRLGKKGRGEQVSKVNDKIFLTVSGYRIQVFSGNDQRRSKEEALHKERLLKENHPELDAYVTFTPPTWRLRVGNFRTYEEADQQLRILRKAFPAFGKEMYIVKEEVHFPLD